MTSFSRIVLVLILLSLAFPAHGQKPRALKASGPVDISAKTVEYNRKENTYTATGNAELHEGTRTLRADVVVYHEDTGDGEAEGHVVFQDAEDIVRAERMTFNVITKEGTIEKGDIYVKKGNFFVQGEDIKKTGESTYVIQRGRFTTCGWDQPAWTFTAKDINLTTGEYATVKNATFRILNQPVFYTPWGTFPIKTERQSGFLLPWMINSSRDGVKLYDSYFWAIAKDQDATFGLQWIQQRGWKPDVEYRYFFSEGLRGLWSGTILNDEKYDGWRGRIMGEHYQEITKSLTLKAKVDYVSDSDYLRDLGLTVLERSENSVKSTVFAEQFLTKSLLTAQTSYFRDLVVQNNDATFQYLPFATYGTEYISLFKDKLYGDLSSEFANLYRPQGDTFSRLMVNPSLRVPFHFKGFNFLASGTLIEQLYGVYPGSENVEQLDNSTKNFTSVLVQGDANVQFYRNYSTQFLNIGNMQSIIKPRLQYTYIPNTKPSDVPSIDPSDTVVETNTITYSFNHYLNAVSETSTRELSLLEIDQTYSLSGDLNPSTLYSGSGNKFSDIHTRLTLYPSSRFSLTNETYLNPYGIWLRTYRNSISFNLPPTMATTVSHTFSKDSINEILWLIGVTFKKFDGRMSIRYSLTDNSWIDTLYAITYHPGCWSFSLTLMQTRTPPDTSIRFSFSLAGITKPTGGY